MSNNEAAKLPLHGIKVLDFSKMIAGPKAAMVLADLGADVIKIEGPGQLDRSRLSGDNPGVIFTIANRNKRSLVLDLTVSRGRELARQLALQSDILIEANRPGLMAKFGLGYEQLRGEAPRLIYASLSGYGSSGPDAARGAVDTVIQAETGLMLNTGQPESPPVMLGGYIVDEAAGLILSQSMLLALFNRERTGCGTHVEVNLLDAALYLQSAEIAFASLTGKQPQRSGNKLPLTAPAGVVEAKDGAMVIVALGDQAYAQLCSIVGRGDLADDPRFNTARNRVHNHDQLLQEISGAMKARTRAEWQELFEAAKLISGPVRTYPEVLEIPQLAANGTLVDGDLRGDSLKLVRWPATVSGRRYPESARTPPPVGEHSAEILAEFGYSDKEIQDLIVENVVTAV